MGVLPSGKPGGFILLGDRDIYAAGPPMLLRALSVDLARRGVDRGRIHTDSFGV